MKLFFKVGMLAALVIAAFIVLVYNLVPHEKEVQKVLPKISKIEPFSLVNQESKPFGYSQLQDKVWVVNFIFTRCKGPCPLMTEKMASLQSEFGKDSRVHYVTITMDANFDSPEVLKAFGKKHQADFNTWNFLTGDPDLIVDIARNIFKVPSDKNPEMHTTRFVLVDAKNHIRGYYDSLDEGSLNSLKQDIKSLQG